MRKRLVLFIIILLVITLSGLVFAEDFAVKINEEYTLSVEEFMSRVELQEEDLQENEKKGKVLNSFVGDVIIKEALKEEGLEVTEEDFYESLRQIESRATSHLNDTYPIGHFSGRKPPKEKIMKRLVEFDEFSFTYEGLKRTVERNAGRRKLNSHFKKEIKKEFEKNKEERKKDLKEYKEQAKEEYAELSDEQKEINSEIIKRIKEMTLEEFKEMQMNEKAPKLIDELINKIKNEMKVEVNEDL